MDVVSNQTKPYHTKPTQYQPTLYTNVLKICSYYFLMASLKCYDNRRRVEISDPRSLKTDYDVDIQVIHAFYDDLVGDHVNVLFCSNCSCA